MTGALQSPESIGEALAHDAWAARGRSLLLRAKPYHEALNVLAERCDGCDLAVARRTFDRRLAELAASSSSIIRPKLPQRRRRRR